VTAGWRGGEEGGWIDGVDGTVAGLTRESLAGGEKTGGILGETGGTVTLVAAEE